MNITCVKFTQAFMQEYRLLAVALFQDTTKLPARVKKIDGAVDGVISEALRRKDFTGKLNQIIILYPTGKRKPLRLMLVGLGKKNEYTLETLRTISGRIALQCRELNVAEYTFLLPVENVRTLLPAAVEASVQGAELALYKFTSYITDVEKLPKPVTDLVLIVPDSADQARMVDAVGYAKAVVEATILARDITNAPSSDMTPTKLSAVAKDIAAKYKLKVNVLERGDMEKKGFGGLLGVSRGSQQPPKFIILEYQGGKEKDPPIVLVGKAVTFDSGGISIKPSEKMEEMKYDKAGGAAVIATTQAAARLKLPVNIVGLISATENLPSGSAYKPGDILRLYGGKTVEVINTDAEGRLILADALGYALNYKPQAIIDLATLTGACVIALGGVCSGVLTNNPPLLTKVRYAAEKSGEKVWELPLWKEYADQIKSEVADMKNVGGRPAGTITAAALLNNFIDDTPWVHVDIAGTAWTQEGMPEKTYLPKGATGVGVRLLMELLRNWRS